MELIWDREDIISIATWSTAGPLGLEDAYDGSPIAITANVVDPDFYDEFDQEFRAIRCAGPC